MANEGTTQGARKKQSQASKRATVDALLNKKRARQEFSIYMQDGTDTTEMTLVFQAIGAQAYDKLVGKHPPTTAQRADGASYNLDTFAPALIAACSVEPEITPDDAKKLWESEEWSRGDLMVLFRNAVELNNRGIDIPFSENG